MKIVVFLTTMLVVTASDLALQELSYANNLFSISLYQTVFKSTNKNFILSPISAETSLSLLQSGCKGPTAEELRTVLYLPNSNEEVESGFQTLLPSLVGNGFYTLHLATKLYGRKNVAFKASYKKTAKQVYKSETETISFAKRVQAAKTINKWVEKNTKSQITEVVAADTLNPNTGLLVVSGFYFRGDWSKPFISSLTRKSSFYRSNYDALLVDMMFQNQPYFYGFYESLELNAKFLEMSFRGGEASMVVVLPNLRDGLSSLENQIDKVLEPHNFTMEQVNVALPKFKLATRLHLKNILKAMGVSRPFDKKVADLSGMSGKKGNLAVSDVLQKSYIDINEGGIELSGATDIDNVARSYGPTPFSVPKDFIADHPFIYYIKIKTVIVSVGRLLDPTQ